MTTNVTPTEKDIAKDHRHDAWLVGIDGENASHFWSQYTQTVIVIDNGDVTVYELAETPCDTLADWRDHVANQRGWADCRIGGSLIEDLRPVMEAAR